MMRPRASTRGGKAQPVPKKSVMSGPLVDADRAALDSGAAAALQVSGSALQGEPTGRLHIRGCSVQLEVVGRLNLDALALDGHSTSRLESQIALNGGAQFVVRRFQANRVLAGVVDDSDAWIVLGVVERDGVPTPRADDALLDLATADNLTTSPRRQVASVPQSAEDVGMVNVAVFKSDQNLVVDFGQELHAALGSITWRGNSCPIAGVFAGQTRVAHLDTPESIWILVIRDDPDDQPGHAGVLAQCLGSAQQAKKGGRAVA